LSDDRLDDELQPLSYLVISGQVPAEKFKARKERDYCYDIGDEHPVGRSDTMNFFVGRLSPGNRRELL
jgi:hypothetical protein